MFGYNDLKMEPVASRYLTPSIFSCFLEQE